MDSHLTELFSCKGAALEVLTSVCLSVLNLNFKFPEGSRRFLKVQGMNLLNLFESFVLSSSQELRSACLSMSINVSYTQ